MFWLPTPSPLYVQIPWTGVSLSAYLQKPLDIYPKCARSWEIPSHPLQEVMASNLQLLTPDLSVTLHSPLFFRSNGVPSFSGSRTTSVLDVGVVADSAFSMLDFCHATTPYPISSWYNWKVMSLEFFSRLLVNLEQNVCPWQNLVRRWALGFLWESFLFPHSFLMSFFQNPQQSLFRSRRFFVMVQNGPPTKMDNN